MAVTLQDTSPAMSTSTSEFGYLVMAFNHRTKRWFNTFTVVGASTGEAAIAQVRRMGFCFGRMGWLLTAKRVALLPHPPVETATVG
jgi:hypothetical protein